MARLVDGNISNMNPQIRGAGETAGQLKIDQKLLEKVLAKQGLGSPEQLAKLLGPEVLQYFRTMSECLNQMCSRMQETEVKTLPAQNNTPKLEEFAQRDTSKGDLYKQRLPENFLTVEKLTLAAKTGLLTQSQAEALKNLFGLSQEARQMRREDVPMPTQTPHSEQEREQGGQQQQQQQGQQQEEEDWADFSAQGSGSSGNTPQGAYYSNDPSQTWGGESGGGFSGGSMRSSMRMGIGSQGGGGAPQGFGGPPPPPPPSGGYRGNAQGQGPGPQMPSNAVGMEQSYLNSNFSPNGPYYGMFESLFGSENWYRNLAGNALGNIQKIREAKQQIMAELAGLDPSKPADAKKLYILQQKLGDMQQSERQWLDNISTAQKANNERKEYIKSILDIFFQTNSAIIRNLRQ